MIKIKSALIVIFTIFCLISLVSLQTVAYQFSKNIDEDFNTHSTVDNYIVKLKDKPLSEFLHEIKNKFDNFCFILL